jgi:hypothetical protein
MIRSLCIRLIGRFIPLRLSIMANKPVDHAVDKAIGRAIGKALGDASAEDERRREAGRKIAGANAATDRQKGWAAS